MTRFGRNASDYDLHEMAGGLPLAVITAPNIRDMSKHGREVCKQTGKSNIPNKKCGSKRTHIRTKQAVKLIVVFLVELIHQKIVNSFQFLLVLNGAKDLFAVFFHGFQ